MTPAARRIARSLRVIKQKAERLRGHDDLPARAAARRTRALECRNRLDWAHQRCAATGWSDPDHAASLDELRAAGQAYQRALYEFLAVAWIFAERAPALNSCAAYRVSAVDELRPNPVQRHLGELHHLGEVDLFLTDRVAALLGEFDRLVGEFDQLWHAAHEAGWSWP